MTEIEFQMLLAVTVDKNRAKNNNFIDRTVTLVFGLIGLLCGLYLKNIKRKNRCEM